MPQSLPGIPCADQLPPGADGLLYRRQRAAQQDRGGDHAAGCQFALQHQPGAASQDRDLDKQAQRLRHTDQYRTTVTRLTLGIQRCAIGISKPGE
jgi:hypothetical protein